MTKKPIYGSFKVLNCPEAVDAIKHLCKNKNIQVYLNSGNTSAEYIALFNEGTTRFCCFLHKKYNVSYQRVTVNRLVEIINSLPNA